MARRTAKKTSARKKAGAKKAPAGKKGAKKAPAGKKGAKKAPARKKVGAKKAPAGKKATRKQPMTFDDLVEKVLDDPQFRAQLVKDPRAALQSQGIRPTDDMVAALNQVDYASITRVAEQFGRDASIHPDTGFT